MRELEFQQLNFDIEFVTKSSARLTSARGWEGVYSAVTHYTSGSLVAIVKVCVTVDSDIASL